MDQVEDAVQRRGRGLEALRAFATKQNELGRLFARRMRMHSTDAAAVVEILTAENRGQPLTPARLAQQIALTTGATSTLLNRLEDAGHIARTREQRDRRVVTLRSTSTVHESADAFFAPLSKQLDEVLSDYSAADLERVEVIVGRLLAVIEAHLDEAEPPVTAG